MFSLPALAGGSIATVHACRRAHMETTSPDRGTELGPKSAAGNTAFFKVAALSSIGSVPHTGCAGAFLTTPLYIATSLLHVIPSPQRASSTKASLCLADAW